jgi:hypothetical protein
MLAEEAGVLADHEGGDPEGGLEALGLDLREHVLDAAGVGPVAHRGLPAVVDLDVAQLGEVGRDGLQVAADLRDGDAGAEAVPGAPALGHGADAQGGVVFLDARGEVVEQRVAVGRAEHGEFLQLPGLAGRDGDAGVEHDLQAVLLREDVELAQESFARREAGEHMVVGGGAGESHAVEAAAFGRIAELEGLAIGVEQVDGVAECADGARDHGEALAVERGFGRQRVGDVEQHDLADAHRVGAGVGERGPAGGAGPGGGEAQTGIDDGLAGHVDHMTGRGLAEEFEEGIAGRGGCGCEAAGEEEIVRRQRVCRMMGPRGMNESGCGRPRLVGA